MDGWMFTVLAAWLATSPAFSNGLLQDEPTEQEISIDLLGTNAVNSGGESEWLESFGENLRVTLDLSTRVLYNTNTQRNFYAQFIGLDVHKVFTGPDGDMGTLLLQPYLTRLDDFVAHPGFYESGDDWELVYRIFNFNYTGLSRGGFNIRVGHMEIPFGLEHVVNTNGTLRDYIHGRNMGVKADWGVSLNGELPSYEYEVALTRGSGNEYSSRGDPFIFAGRIGTPRAKSLSFGLSAMHGKTQSAAETDNTIERTRFGVDVIWETGPFTVLSEFSFGDNQGTDLYNTIFEIDWHNDDETWLIYNQFQIFGTDFATGWDDNIINIFGIRWAPDSHWALSAQWSQDLSTFGAAPEKAVLSAQLRYRF